MTLKKEMDSTGAEFKEVGFGRLLKWGVICMAFLFCLWGVGSVFGLVGTVATTGKKIVTKTLDADNIIATYEGFHDRWKAFDARTNQILSHGSLIKHAETAEERARLRVEVEAMRQSCRDIAARYNADTAKINRTIFKGRSAPETLNMEKCDA